MSKTFKIANLELEYCFSDYNRAFNNERKCEVPLGRWFVDKFNNDAIEVGSVLKNYGRDQHNMLDLTDNTHPNIINANALDYDYTNLNVITLSTIEHFMKREYSNGSNQDSIVFIEKVMKEAKSYLIEFPCSYNEFLDEYIKNHPAIPKIIMERINWANEWKQVEDVDNYVFPYFGHRDGRAEREGVYNNSNAIVLIYSSNLFD